MGTMTRDEMAAELLFQLKNRTDAATTGGASPARLHRWLNWSYLHVGHPNVVGHWELMSKSNLTLINGTNTYLFNPLGGRRVTGLISVRHIQATTDTPTARGNKLTPVDIRWIEDRSQSTGVPRTYAVFGNDLVIDSVPGATENNQLLRVRAVLEPVQFAAASDLTILDAVWDEVIVVGARWRALRDLDRPDKAELAKQDFAALIQEYEDKDAFHGMEWGWRSEAEVGESYQDVG